MKHDIVIEMVFAELRAAEKKHPGWPDDTIHAVGIITEEVGEAMREAIDLEYGMADHDEAQKRLVKELAQTAAMAIRALENL